VTALDDHPLLLNVASAQGDFLCPCCGCGDQFTTAPYHSSGGRIGVGICGCCFWEPGFDDDPHASQAAHLRPSVSLRLYREAWIAAGFPWRGQSANRPADYDGAAQLKRLEGLAPHLASTALAL
jgi:hypothetical protein